MGKKRILLIEDDRSLLITLRYLLEDMGYEVVVAEDHPQARAAIAQERYDAAIVDYFLDNVPSTELISLLRSSSPGTPVVCSTAAYAEQIKLHPDAQRPNAFLYKPFSVAQLRDTLSSLLSI
jgi:DNA-binding response OmpR family regulator